MKSLVFFFACTLALVLTNQAHANEYVFNFDSDMEDMTIHRGKWHWSNRANVGWKLPDGSNGFALYNDPGEGDEFYSEFIPVEYGLNYTITFFIASEWRESTTLQLQKLSRGGEYLETIIDFYKLSSPDNTEWVTRTGYVPPGQNALFAVFCQTGKSNPVTDTGYLWGCAIDSMTLTTGPVTGPTTTTTPEPTTTTTTPEPTTTTTTPEPTTTTTTPEPTTTTTTPEPTTTTTTPEPTTTTTTPEPTTTTTTPEPTTTTLEPDTVIDFNFENGTDGWVLGHSNGAAWRREINSFPSVEPIIGNYMLRVHPTDFYSSVVMAMSPRMVVGPTGSIRLGVNFYMSGDAEYPTYLKLRRTTSYTTFDESPSLNLDGFGEQLNQDWLQHGILYTDLTPGEEFNIVIEASLGIKNEDHDIAVSRVQIEGAELVNYPEEDFFDFSGGLIGWSMGSVDGGRWLVYNHSEIDANFYIPPPSVGDNILVIDRFDIHSGVISIESPPISFTPGTSKELNLRFWMRGSAAYPSSMRIRMKTLDGNYAAEPFLDLTPYGNVNNLLWQELDTFYAIPTDWLGGNVGYFQLVIEADLGSGASNLVAIDAININTRVTVPKYVKQGDELFN